MEVISYRESHNATSKKNFVQTISEDPRGALLKDSQEKNQQSNITECSKIKMKLQNFEVSALIDTGCPVTCISEEFHYMHVDNLGKCPTLPIIVETNNRRGCWNSIDYIKTLIFRGRASWQNGKKNQFNRDPKIIEGSHSWHRRSTGIRSSNQILYWIDRIERNTKRL